MTKLLKVAAPLLLAVGLTGAVGTTAAFAKNSSHHHPAVVHHHHKTKG